MQFDKILENPDKYGRLLVKNNSGEPIGYIFANEPNSKGIVYSLDETTVIGTTINPPPSIEIRPGTKSIAPFAFSNSDVEIVALPDSVEVIGDNAFSSSCLKHINLDNVLSFGSYAFANSHITHAVINKNAKFNIRFIEFSSEGAATFFACPDLKKVIFGPSIVPRLCFFSSGIESFISEKVTEIGTSAFEECKNLKTFVFNEGLEKINMRAFTKSGIEKILLPSSLKALGKDAFNECENLTCVVFSNTEPKQPLIIDSNCFSKTSIREFTVPSNCVGLASGVVNNCQNLETLRIEANLECVPFKTARSCKNLKNVYLNPTVKVIDESAFFDTGLEIIDENFKNIEKICCDAFNACSNLKFVRLHDTITMPRIFKNCPNLELVVVDNDKFMHSKTFLGIDNTNPLKILVLNHKNDFPLEVSKTTEVKDKITPDLTDKLLTYMSFRELSKLGAAVEKNEKTKTPVK